MIAVLTLFLILLVAYQILGALDERGSETRDERAWEAALDAEENLVGRILVGVGRPFAGLNAVQSAKVSPQWKFLEAKLRASGGMYGNSVEVFISVQFGALFVASMLLAAALGFQATGAALLSLTLGAFALGGYPISQVLQKVKKRSAQVTRELPDFAELLQMPLTSGYGIIPSLAFTAREGEGPVEVEVRSMLARLRAKPGSDSQVFAEAGDRLGTPEAQAFFQALAQAHLEGDKVARTLAAQAEALRVKAFQQARAENQKLPVKLIVLMGMHLLPLLFIVALLPVALGLGSLS